MPNTLSLLPWLDTQKPVDPVEPPMPPTEPPKYICSEDNCMKQFDNAYSLKIHGKVHRQKAALQRQPRLACPYDRCQFTARYPEKIREHVQAAHIRKNMQQRSNDSRNCNLAAQTAPHVLDGHIRRDAPNGMHRPKANNGLDPTRVLSHLTAAQLQYPQTPPSAAVVHHGPLPTTVPVKRLAALKPYPSPIRAVEGFTWFSPADDTARDSLSGK